MFVIFGLGPKHKVEAMGQFDCPKCSIKTEYNVKSSRQYFRLFFIPIFPIGNKNEPSVECQTCNRTYYTEVLENNNYNVDGSPYKKDDYDIKVETESNETHTIKNCPNCQTKIRLQKGKVGTVKCPNCQRRIYTSTQWTESIVIYEKVLSKICQYQIHTRYTLLEKCCYISVLEVNNYWVSIIMII